MTSLGYKKIYAYNEGDVMTIEKISAYGMTLLFCISLLIHVSRKENRYWGAYDNFRLILATTAMLTILEFFSWLFECVPGRLPRTINIVSNYLVFYLSALPTTVWFMYFDSKMQLSTKVIRIKKFYYIVVNGVIIIFTTVNIFMPILFRIDEYNKFVGYRGTMIIAAIQMIFVMSYVVEIFSLRDNIEKRLLTMVILLAVLPITAAMLQSLFYGIVILWPIMTYVAFVAFLLIERDEMGKDPLTKLPLRRQMEARLQYMLSKNMDFSLIMIDLNDFKLINDNYGHMKGDEVLRDFAHMLRKSVGRRDLVFRYAGDEFVIITEDKCDDLECSVIESINNSIDEYNSTSIMSQKLSMSHGVSHIYGAEHESIVRVLAIVDDKMYENKRIFKERRR